MNKTFAASLVALATATAHADSLQLSPRSPLPLDVQREAGVRMRNAGIITTVAGVLMAATGTVLMVRASDPKRDDDGVFIEFPIGTSLAVAGGIGMITGLSLVGAGQSRANKAERATLALSPAGATIRF